MTKQQGGRFTVRREQVRHHVVTGMADRFGASEVQAR
jgi:hypothetical protein